MRQRAFSLRAWRAFALRSRPPRLPVRAPLSGDRGNDFAIPLELQFLLRLAAALDLDPLPAPVDTELAVEAREALRALAGLRLRRRRVL
jgi:hypothetical protein